MLIFEKFTEFKCWHRKLTVSNENRIFPSLPRNIRSNVSIFHTDMTHLSLSHKSKIFSPSLFSISHSTSCCKTHVNVLIQGSSAVDWHCNINAQLFFICNDLIWCCHPRVLHTVKLFSFAPASSSLNDNERIANDLMKPFSLSLLLRDFLIHSYVWMWSSYN